jgi:hypothetical protein
LTEFVNSSAETLEDGISKMFSAMIKDYGAFMPTDSEIRINMNEEYVDGLTFKRGSKYIKVISRDRFNNTKFNMSNINYWDYPWEIEAFGRQLGLFVRFCEDQGIANRKDMQEDA